MIHSTRTSLLILCLLLLVPCMGSTQNSDSLAYLYGKVEFVEDTTNVFFPVSKNNKEFPRAFGHVTLFLVSPDSSEVYSALTNENSGEYVIKGVKPGNYTLIFSYLSYETVSYPLHLNPSDTLEKNVIVGHVYPPEELPFGAPDAIEDINNGVVEIKQWPIIEMCHYCTDEVDEKIKDFAIELRRNYGFVEQNLFIQHAKEIDENWEKVRQAHNRYNLVVEEYLEKRNGKDWRKRYDKELKEERIRLYKESQ